MRVSDRTRGIVVALALAVAAALIITLAVKKSGNNKSSTKPVGTATVFVATRDIAASTPGSDLGGKIRKEQVPQPNVVAGAITSVDQVRNLVSTAVIYSGEQV